MLTFETAIAVMPGGRFEGGRYRVPCPAHGGSDRNLSVWPDENGDACFKCWSHNCGTKEIIAALGVPSPKPAPAAAPKRWHPASEHQRIAAAREVWRQSGDPRGTVAHDYLFGRGWTLAIPASIRFHPRQRHPTGVYLPAMVAAIDDRDGRTVGVHRTFLRPDGGGKAEVEPNRMALGLMKGCAVRLTAGARELVLSEGIETGLSIIQATGMHVWAALGTANLGQVELPGGVFEVIIAADHDEPGIAAARAAAEAYQARGFQVQIVSPPTEKADWNDVLLR